MRNPTIQEIDVNHYVFEDSTVVNERHGLSVESYLHGRCHIFAVALKKAFKDRAQIFAIIGLDEPESGVKPNSPTLAHAYVVLDKERFVDARGGIGDWNLEDYTEDILESVTVAFESNEIKEHTHEGAWGAEMEGEVDELTQFILTHRPVFESRAHLLEEGDPELSQFTEHLAEVYGFAP